MRYCTVCGAPLSDANTRFCPNCGKDLQVAPASAAAPAQPAAAPINPAAQMKKRSPELAPAGLDKATFFKRYSLGRQNCVAAAILCYISAGITTVLALTSIVDYINIYAFIDVFVILALSLLIHLLRSRVASVLLLAYALYNMVVMIISTGQFSGWWLLIAGVFAVIGSFQCVKEWKAYLLRTQQPSPAL